MRALPLAALLAALLAFTGCTLLPPPSPPAPGRTRRPAPAPEARRLPPPEEPPPPAPEPAPEPERAGNPAVLALLDQARAQSASGRKDAAGASLERALRIDPGNPVLWQELARLRLGQGRYRQAENLAAKSNALAGGDRRLRAGNWRIIGRARAKLGDRDGAEAAFRRAEER